MTTLSSKKSLPQFLQKTILIVGIALLFLGVFTHVAYADSEDDGEPPQEESISEVGPPSDPTPSPEAMETDANSDVEMASNLYGESDVVSTSSDESSTGDPSEIHAPLDSDAACETNSENSSEDEEINKEHNQIFTCQSDGPFKIQREELSRIKFFSIKKLTKLIAKHPERFTPGFVQEFEYYIKNIKK